MYGRGDGLPAPGPRQGPVGAPDTPTFLRDGRVHISACQQSPRDGGKSGKTEKNAGSLTWPIYGRGALDSGVFGGGLRSADRDERLSQSSGRHGIGTS